MKNNFITKIIGATLAFAMMIGGAVGINAQAKPTYATDVSYKLTIDTSSFNTTSYAANNNEKETDAVCTTDATKKMKVKWTSNQIMLQSSLMQWQKNVAYLYNSTNLGTITSVTVTSTAGTFTTNYGTSAQPSSGSAGSGKGYFKTSVGNATGKSSKVEVLFTITEGGSSSSSSSSSSSAAPVTYTVTYANGGATSGTVPADNTAYEAGDEVTVLGNTGNLDKNGYTFTGWTDGNNNYEAGDEFNISSDVTLTATWAEEVDDGASTYLLKNMSGFSSWGNSYSDHSHTYTVSQNETAVVTIKGASKQTATITDVPVTKGGDVTFKLNSSERYIKNITFHARQWSDKTQTMTLHTSTNGGTSYTSTEISTSYFLIRGKNLASGTNAIKITFNSSNNQVGCVDFKVLYDYLPTQQASSMTFSPTSLSLYGGEEGTFTPTLLGGQGNYEKTITWTSSHPAIIAAPANSEAGEEVSVTPAEVASDTDVTITGTVDVTNGASASIVITVKLIKTVSVNHVEISGIENNQIFDGSSDNAIAINKTIKLDAEVVYNQGDAYMDGNDGISWSTSNESVATVSSTGLVTFKGNGTAAITATSTEEANKSASLSFTIESINPELGTSNNPFTVAQAIAAIEAKGTISNAYAKGIISRIDNISSGAITYWISDDGTTTTQLEAYKGKNVSGASFSAITDIELGASVTITGTLKKYNTTYEFDQNNRIVSYNEPTDEFRLGSYLSTASSVISISATENRSSNVEPESIVFGEKGLENAQQYSDPFNGGHFTITFAGGANDGRYYTDGAAIRTYGGGSITVESEEPITKIEFTWVGGNSYKPSSDDVVDIGTYNVDTGVWSGNANSITLVRPSGSGHWRLNTVAVTYGALESVTDLKLRFGASISVEKWNAINALEDYEITDYGVMLFKTRAQNAETAPTVQSLRSTNPEYVEVFSKGSGVAPTAEDGKYTFTARIDYSNEDEYSKYIIAQAFVVINGTDYRFLGEEMRASVRSLAGTANVNTNLSPDALTYLTTAGN